MKSKTEIQKRLAAENAAFVIEVLRWVLDGGCAFRPRCRFAVDRCGQEFPPLDTVDGDHVSACWRVEEINELKNAS